MQTELADFIRDTPDGEEAAAIIGRCVHCGFCNATCPSYQLLGDELDGPRGRIYLIKQVLEGSTPSASTRLHLDRCLGCRACETTCPSGVEYGRLLDIGRNAVAQRTRRPAAQAALRWLLRTGLGSRFFAPALALGRALRPLLPPVLRDHMPLARAPGAWPARTHSRRMLLLTGCVQPAMLPNINAATARVFDALGVQLVVSLQAGCCGALHQHLDDPGGAQRMARRNIDAWWPHIESGCEAILVNARLGGGRGSRGPAEFTFAVRHGTRFATVARVQAVLPAEEWTELEAWIARHTTQRFGPVRAVEPALVFELACDGLAPAPRTQSGVRLERPRLVRWRRDRTADSIPTLKEWVVPGGDRARGTAVDPA